jgi:GTP-binding protein HflX
VLADIGAQDLPRIRVFNKIDGVGDAAAQAVHEAGLRAHYPDCFVMSARRDADVARLHAAIRDFFQKDLVEAELLLPWSAQRARGEIFASCEVLEERSDEAGALLRVRGDAATVARLRAQFDRPA